MRKIIMKTFISIFVLCFVAMTSFAQPTNKIEPVKEKTNKIEIKQENQIKDGNVIKISDDKSVKYIKSHDCSHPKDCKTGSGNECCKMKNSAKMGKESCKEKNNMKTHEVVKPEDNGAKSEIK
ncbi:MAG: hypothetical protein EPN82_00310 [Bacteroidetes bacterium]|nr:MAG: hypothetical protein EPN82_00310 [Bacteroidota bacterium]